jgi:hypothetical protein
VPSFPGIKKKPECTLIRTDPESGIKTWVCRVDPDTIYEVKVDKQGNILPELKSRFPDPKEFEKIHNALQKQQTQAVV